jgi:hypothetical protein
MLSPVDHDERRDAGVRAAVAVAGEAGWHDVEPEVLQHSNNIVVWLRPHPIVAKVGTQLLSHASLTREADACALLADQGAPVGVPARPGAVIDPATGFPVSLWHRLEETGDAAADPVAYAEALRAVHIALRSVDLELPSFLANIDHARRTLFDDAAMHLLPAADLAFVRERFDDLDARVRAHPLRQQAIHGEPHVGNVLATADGPRLIDFEGVCIGPIELDLACVDPRIADLVAERTEVDPDLLALTRQLISACVTTWGFQLGDLPYMRAHGETHLAILRARSQSK